MNENETKKKKILIIEDEKPLAHALELKLSHEGFDVVSTNSGETGLQYLREGHFDLVLTDLIIPGLDGFKVLETIQEQHMNVPAIVMTNLNQEEDRKRVFDLGAVSFFVKSNSPISEIVESIKNKIGATGTTSNTASSEVAPSVIDTTNTPHTSEIPKDSTKNSTTPLPPS